MLKGTEAIYVSTILEDCVDQLNILGNIMPVSYEGRPDSDEMVTDEISRLVDGQKSLETKYASAMNRKRGLRMSGGPMKDLMEADRGVQDAGMALKNSTQIFARGMKQSPLTEDNLQKVQNDRGFLEEVMSSTLAELSQGGNFEFLTKAVMAEKQKKAQLQDMILKEEEGRKRVKTLHRQLQDVKKEKEVEIQNRNEMIAHLKDQLQEMKAKTNMEGKYIKKCADVAVAQTQKRCYMSEKEMKDEIESLRLKVDEETRVNTEIESYLRTHQTDLEQKVEHWMEKYDKDVESKQHELDVLKASKAKDLERLHELTKLYQEYEQVVVEDRIEKEKIRRKAEQEALELKSTVQLQSWWRGMLVRKGLGPYGKKKKGKKGKKGKKSGKKGKKGKKKK